MDTSAREELGLDSPPVRRPYLRRREDEVCHLLLAGTAAEEPGGSPGPSLRIRHLEVELLNGVPTQAVPVESPPPEYPTVLIETGDREAVMVVGGALRHLSTAGGRPLLVEQAAAGAAAWRRERLREVRRGQVADFLMAFAQQLNTAKTARDVQEVLVSYAVRIVGGYAAVILVPEPERARVTVYSNVRLERSSTELAPSTATRLRSPGVILPEEADAGTGAPFAELSWLFGETGARMILRYPFSTDGALLLVERRADRAFEVDDWRLLEFLTGEATGALERISLLEEIRKLSLTDPLTGLANRRRMRIVLEHSLAAARRGEPLAVAMIDLDDFKRVNDIQGHVFGDRILCLVADCLREEVRGSDVAVRYGGDEFLVILPGTGREGARALLDRVRERLADRAQISIGVAEYDVRMGSSEELIEAADQDLYSARREREVSYGC